MNPIDIVLVVVLVLSAIQGFRSGLVASVASLLGLIGGIAIASWNYTRLAGPLKPILRDDSVAAAVAFVLIALAVMLLTGLLGLALKRLVHGVGLGWLDRLAGALFGLLRGGLLVTLCIVTVAAFFPGARWIGEARLAKYFLGTANLTTHMTPQELKAKILHGLEEMERDSPGWLHPK